MDATAAGGLLLVVMLVIGLLAFKSGRRGRGAPAGPVDAILRARGEIVRVETRRRGFFGWLFLVIFLGFNVVMLLWLWNYLQLVSADRPPEGTPGRVGADLGAMFGTVTLLIIWACGAVVTGLLALLTRPGRREIRDRYE